MFHLRDADQRVTRLAGELLWARDGVGGGLVGIVGDASVRALVGAGEGNETAGLCASTTGDLELMAPGVELRSRVRTRSMQGDDLMAHKIVAWLEARRNSVSSCAALLHELGCAPGSGGTGPALFFDFEPYSTGRVSLGSIAI